MAQLSIFSDNAETPSSENKAVWEIFVDGASRNNPGHSGVGIYIKKNDEDFVRTGFYLGIKTNNEAEYMALILALFLIEDELQDLDQINITSDSQLLINQLKKIYAVKKPELRKLYNVINIYLNKYHYRLHHVLRDHNKVADKLANIAVDKRVKLTKTLMHKIDQHDIKI